MKIGTSIKDIWHALLDAALPEECVVCGRPLVEGEQFLCLHCLYDMPAVEIDDYTDNPLHVTLATVNPVHKAASLFYYRRGGDYARLIHHAKYNERPQLARWLGKTLADRIKPHGFFDDIDALVSVPVSTWKLIRRGYNQSLELAKGISSGCGVPVLDVLGAKRHSTQTRKGASGRRANARGVFYLKNQRGLEDVKHLAIVDDVITTGSTVLECASVIRTASPDIKISVLSGALTII